MKQISKCCGAEAKTEYAEEGTGCYMCQECFEACDVREGENYSFNIWLENDWYLARVFIDGVEVGVTQGRTKEEIFAMVADCYMCAEDISMSWWNKLLSRLMKY